MMRFGDRNTVELNIAIVSSVGLSNLFTNQIFFVSTDDVVCYTIGRRGSIDQEGLKSLSFSCVQIDY
jgi:hypothetical protein